jgi:hypothetical protein
MGNEAQPVKKNKKPADRMVSLKDKVLFLIFMSLFMDYTPCGGKINKKTLLRLFREASFLLNPALFP